MSFIPQPVKQMQMFARGFSPLPHLGDANTKQSLYDSNQPSSRTLAQYPQDHVLNRLQTYYAWADGFDVATVLEHDYRTDRGKRVMDQHGGDKDYYGTDKGLNMTYSSQMRDRSDPRHFYNMMFEADESGPDVIGWRDLSMLAMVPGVPGAWHMATGASGVAITLNELSDFVKRMTGVRTYNRMELAAFLYALNYGVPVGKVKTEYDIEGSIKAKEIIYDHENKPRELQGRLFLNDNFHNSGLILTTVSNVQINDRDQKRRLFNEGVVGTGRGFTPLIADRTGQARDGNEDIERHIGQWSIHEFYKLANEFIRRITGMNGYRMIRA